MANFIRDFELVKGKKCKKGMKGPRTGHNYPGGGNISEEEIGFYPHPDPTKLDECY